MNILSAAVGAHRQLVERIRQAFPDIDEETLAGSVESETELDGVIVAAVRQALEREALSAALSLRIKEMQERKKRLDDGAEVIRRAVLDAMLSVAWKKLPMPVPDFTLSIGAGTPKLIVTDESALPFDLLEVVSKPNRAAIKEALKAGREVKGAELSNAEPHLIVSRR